MQEQEVGKVEHYFGKISVAIIKLSGELKVGDKIHIKGAHVDFTQTVDSLQIEHKVLTEGKPGEPVGTKVAEKVHENDVVYKVLEE